MIHSPHWTSALPQAFTRNLMLSENSVEGLAWKTHLPASSPLVLLSTFLSLRGNLVPKMYNFHARLFYLPISQMSIQQFTWNSVNILPTICKAPGLNKTFLPLATSIWLQSPSQPPWHHKCGLHVISCFLWPWFILEFCRSFCYILKIQLSFSYACVMLNPLTPACRMEVCRNSLIECPFLFLRALNYGGTLYK